MQNPTNIGDGLITHPQPRVDAQNCLFAENLVDDVVRMQPPIPRPQKIYKGNVNINNS